MSELPATPMVISPASEKKADARRKAQNGQHLSGRLRKSSLAIIILALLSISATFFVLLGTTPIEPTQSVINYAMIINGGFVLLLVYAIALEVMALVSARRGGRAAARLHVRVVALFSIIAAMPALLVAVLAAITLDRGLDRWFQDRSRQIVDNALIVAQAYLQEHGRVLRAHLIALSQEIEQSRAIFDYEPSRFDRIFRARSLLRGLDGAFLIRHDGAVLLRILDDENLDLPLPPLESYKNADKGEPVLIAPGRAGLVGGVMQLENFDNSYLYIARSVDQRVIDHMQLAEEGAAQYSEMEKSRLGVQITFAFVYFGVALVLLLTAIWFGFGFANRLIAPIRRLIGAADAVSQGDLQVHVETDKSTGDMANLTATFNRMTEQLRAQRFELLSANSQIDERRRFTEAILSGATAGVIGVDMHGNTSFANRSALQLLNMESEEFVGQPLASRLPKIAEIIAKIEHDNGRRLYEDQIQFASARANRIINIRVTWEKQVNSDQEGVAARQYVITLDDVTDLITAQRMSAWADIARRIAHEIKNPLTPIQLSAERISKRYRDAIKIDREVFDRCIETIIRQVGDIGRMVDEFSAFARMPKPVMQISDMREIVRETVFAQGVSHPQITLTADMPDDAVMWKFDPRLIAQALTNVIKNAAEAVEAKEQKKDDMGAICVKLRISNEDGGDISADLAPGDMASQAGRQQICVIEIIDDGIGLPEESRAQLLEPYKTTREKGTGLGLAIVRKVMEDHNGRIELLDNPHCTDGGTLVRLSFSEPRP